MLLKLASNILPGSLRAFLLVAICIFAGQLNSRAVVVTNLTQAGMQAALTNGGTLTFTAGGTITLTNELKVSTNTTIDGAGVAIAFSGSSTTRVFFVNNNVTLTLANLSVIDGRNTNGGAVYNSSGATLNISNCTFSGNHAFGPNGKNGNNASSNGKDGGSGLAGTNGIGGAIYNLGALNITNSLISSNTASGGDGGNGGNGGDDSAFGGNGGNGANGAVAWGGAIYNAGSLFIINSTLTNNFALGGFGGLPGNGGTAPFPGTPGRGGAGASALGGAIYNVGTATITNSTFVTNAVFAGDSAHAGVDKDGAAGGLAFGGAIFSSGPLSIGNSTLTANFASGGKGGDVYSGNFVTGGNGGAARGGAICSSNSLSIASCTLATNGVVGGAAGINPLAGHNGSPGASLGGNVYRGAGSLVFHNTILSKGTNGLNFAGSTAGIDGGRNFSSDASCSFSNASRSTNNINSRLLPLANNGGLTATMALATNSPAIDAGDTLVFPATDQRGIARPQGKAPDIGAFELVPTFSISGRILEGTNGLSNIVVTAGSQSATSRTNGDYTISGLVASNYLVTPTAIGSGFTPPSTNVVVGTNGVNPSGNVSNINFVANGPISGAPTITFPPTNGNLSNAVFSWQISAMPKRTYKVQYKTNLNSTNWVNISTNISTTNGLFQFSQTNLTKDPQRYYRVIQ